jgi:HlyD family secretion protein
MMQRFFTLLIILFVSCSRSPETVKPQRKNITEAVYASGKIISQNEYNVFALSSGTVKEKKVKEGDVVSKDQVLYVISNDAPSARMDAARSAFENARLNLSDRSGILNDLRLAVENAHVKFSNDSVNYFRFKKLLNENATSQSNLDNAYTAYIISLNQRKSAEEKYRSAQNDLNVAFENAKSQLAAAQNDLGNYFIRAVSGGTVFQLSKEAGEAVHAGEVVALLGESNSRIIKLAVDQQDISRIKTGQEVLLKTDVNGNSIYKAEISHVYPVMNEVDQTFRADAIFKDSTQQPFIHSSVEANIIIQKKENALVIPRKALLEEDSLRVKREGKIITIAVKTGIRTLDDVEVLSGIDESSEVVVPSK